MQLACAEVLGDEKWVDEYLEEVRSREERSDELGTRKLRSKFVYASSFSLNAKAAFIAA